MKTKKDIRKRETRREMGKMKCFMFQRMKKLKHLKFSSSFASFLRIKFLCIDVMLLDS